jgi:predicted DNA-binding ribbon-helix-helix protein
MSNLIIHNFRLKNKRSSIKLESEMWQSFANICLYLNINKNSVLSYLAEYKDKHRDSYSDTTFTSFVRIFIVQSLAMTGSKASTELEADQVDLGQFVHSLMSRTLNPDRRRA